MIQRAREVSSAVGGRQIESLRQYTKRKLQVLATADSKKDPIV